MKRIRFGLLTGRSFSWPAMLGLILGGVFGTWLPSSDGPSLAIAQSDKDEVTEMMLHPAVEPKPALQYRLLPRFPDTRPGNAAVFYGKIKAEMSNFFNQPDLNLRLSDLQNANAETVLGDNLAQSLGHQSRLTYYHHQAALCRTCDWQLPINDPDVPMYGILLPEIQEARGLVRMSLVAARYQIFTGDFDTALQSLQDSFAYGKHVASPPSFAVSSLVGLAIDGMALQQVQLWIQQPKAPSLYWALTSLPRPIIDTRSILEVESTMIAGSFPFVQHIESDQFNESYWNDALRSVLDARKNFWGSIGEEAESELVSQLQLIRAYPQAQSFLLEAGYSKHRIAAMPVSQVILLASYRQSNEMRDQLIRWQYVDPAEGRDDYLRRERDQLQRGRDEILPGLFSMGIPAFEFHSTAADAVQRQIDVLRILEAIRLHGQLPESLSDIDIVPIPKPPVGQTQWDYQKDGSVARLRWKMRPFSPTQVYEIRMSGATADSNQTEGEGQ